MKATAKIENPGSAEMTLTLTLRVSEWKEFADMQQSAWPAWPVASLINQAIRGTIEHVESAREVSA